MSYSLHSKLRGGAIGLRENDASIRFGVTSAWAVDTASSVEGGGETHLGVGNYTHTSKVGEVITAINQDTQKWHLIPLNNTPYHLIAADADALQVWTAGGWLGEIKIKPFTGEDGQFFKFARST